MMFLLKYWRWAAVALVLFAIVSAIGYYGHTQRKQGEADVKAQWDQQRADQTAAALTTLQAAIERDAAERKAMEDSRVRAADTLLGAINVIRTRVGSINQKLEDARNADPECAAWLDGRVACPIPWRVPDDSGPTPNDPGAGPDAVRPGARLVSVADPTAGPGTDDKWSRPPVRGRIARPD